MWDFPNKNRGKKTKKVREILKLSSFIFQIIKLLKLLAPKKREYNIECIVIWTFWGWMNECDAKKRKASGMFAWTKKKILLCKKINDNNMLAQGPTWMSFWLNKKIKIK